MGLEVFERAGTRVAEHACARQNAAIRLLIASVSAQKTHSGEKREKNTKLEQADLNKEDGAR